ncbi:putative oxidoreductase CatD [Streptosporangium roseum]|uniref:DoxX family protein n=1 Tax=Streptosporangium roseum TaxID=2001 RepID=UPI0030A1114E
MKLDQTRSISLLLARIAIGTIFIVHGLEKLNERGVGGTIEYFDSLGIPLAVIAAPAVLLLEMIGGAAVILGAGLPLAGVLLAIDMVGAIFFVQGPKGWKASELCLSLLVGSLVLAFSGGGALAMDKLWLNRTRKTTTS